MIAVLSNNLILFIAAAVIIYSAYLAAKKEHASKNIELEKALARQSGGDRFSATGFVGTGPSRQTWIQRVEPSHLITIGVIGAALFALVAVAGIVWQWRKTSANDGLVCEALARTSRAAGA